MKNKLFFYLHQGNSFESKIESKSGVCWECHWYTEDKYKSMMEARDKTTGTTFLPTYNSLSAEYKRDYIKYYILYFWGGVFINRDIHDNEEELSSGIIDVAEKLTKYCQSRHVGFLETINLSLTTIPKHPELITILSDEPFRPLNFSVRKDTQHKTVKTVISSLDSMAYVRELEQDLDKIETSADEKVSTTTPTTTPTISNWKFPTHFPNHAGIYIGAALIGLIGTFSLFRRPSSSK